MIMIEKTYDFKKTFILKKCIVFRVNFVKKLT